MLTSGKVFDIMVPNEIVTWIFLGSMKWQQSFCTNHKLACNSHLCRTVTQTHFVGTYSDFTRMALPKLKLAKFLEHGVVCEGLASNPVPTGMANSCYWILLGKWLNILGSGLKTPWITLWWKGFSRGWVGREPVRIRWSFMYEAMEEETPVKLRQDWYKERLPRAWLWLVGLRIPCFLFQFCLFLPAKSTRDFITWIALLVLCGLSFSLHAVSWVPLAERRQDTALCGLVR